MSDAATPAPAPAGRRPWWRDPFVIAFFAGIVLVTLAAPRFRRVAPEPEIGPRLPAWRLTAGDGAEVSSESMAGRIALVALVSSDEPDAARVVAAAVGELAPRFATARCDVALLLVDVTGEGAPAGVAWPAATLLHGEGACALAVAGFAPGATSVPDCDAARALARDPRLLLVDGLGRTRGAFGTRGEALYEAFERTLRACDAQSR